MSALKVYYAHQQYRSHARCAQDYLRVMGGICEQVPQFDQADVVLLHFEPQHLHRLYQQNPELRQKYVVGYVVWETDRLPDVSAEGVHLAQEIWTPSRYCQATLQKTHPNVHVVPHVVSRETSFSDGDHQRVRSLIRHAPSLVYFLSITKLKDPRKNVGQLVGAFKKHAQRHPDARLILKTAGGLPGWATEPSLLQSGIIVVSEMLSDQEINALYDLSDVYVSVHHSEAWGLTMSDAMLFRMPVIATGYSGNLEFMNADNAILISAREGFVAEAWGLFSTDMKWGHPDGEDLEKALDRCHHEIRTQALEAMTDRALVSVSRFAPETVKNVIRGRFDAIRRVVRK